MEQIDKIDEHLKILNSKVLSFQLLRGDSEKELIGQNTLWVICRALNYSLYINSGILELYRTQNIFASIFLIRANYEVTGMLANIHNNIFRYYAQEITLEEYESILKRYHGGSNMINCQDREVPKPINTLNGIDSVDKWMTKELTEKNDLFRDNYNYLSEFCHPNFHGLSSVSSFKNGFISKKSTEEIALAHTCEFYLYLEISNILFLEFYEKIIKLLKDNEELHILK